MLERRPAVLLIAIAAVCALETLSASAGLAQVPEATVRKRPPTLDTVGYAGLTVEGGGTLGAYEGGLTWALLEIFRQRRLLTLPQSVMASANKPFPGDVVDTVAVDRLPFLELKASAGASAGSINAFIAANRWCSIDPAESDQTSSFWKVWVETGLSDILPSRRDREWRTDKAIFNRKHLSGVFTKLDTAWSRGRYAPDCKVSFGATITRLAPDSLILSDRVQPRNQRYGSAFAVEAPPSGTGHLIFRRPKPDPASRIRLGALVELPLDQRDGTIEHDYAQRLINASSGYPLAFQPQLVHYCAVASSLASDTATGNQRAAGRPVCTKSTADSAFFIDGGVFDNGPLTLSYGLSLAADSAIKLSNLNMLFVSPGQRRHTGNRRDAFSSDRGEVDTAKARVAESPSEGLDALSKLVATFIPSARHYELQIAARVLPMIEIVEQREEVAALARQVEAIERKLEGLERQMDEKTLQLQSDLNALAISTLTLENDILRSQLARCRITPDLCVGSKDDSALVSGPQRAQAVDPVKGAASIDSARGQRRLTASGILSFHRNLYTSTRWHPVAGEWLFGFGGFIGRPLREYDFYVGVYDAFSLIAEQISCRGSPDTACVRARLHGLIEKPLVPLSDKGRVVLAALYKEEYPAGTERFSIRADTTNDLLLHIVRAMAARMSTTRLPPTACHEGGRLERLSCNEGIDTVFSILRKSVNIEGRTPANCVAENRTVGECPRDKRFADFVHNTNVALNQLTGEVLERLLAATPDSSALRFPLTVATAMYFSTNERGRTDLDAGSVSLPSLPLKKLVFFIATPSGVGGFAGYRGWYLEWAARWHVSPTYALGVAARPVWGSKFSSANAPDRGSVFIPALRAEVKPWGWITPWVSTAAIDLAYWSEHDAHEFWSDWNANNLTFALTSALFMQRARVSVYRRPSNYAMRSGDKPKLIVSLGLGDTSGALYWLFRSIR